MIILDSKYKIANKFLIVFILSIFYLLFAIFTHAQSSPQVFVSWQAENYAPSWYQGKILPIKSTPVNIRFELIDGGKVADLSKTTVRWYVNDNLVINEKNGLGIKNLKTNIPDSSGNQTEIRIAIIGYKGVALIDKIIEIPVVSPEAVINSPYANGEIKIGSSVLGLSPFFFNTNDPNSLSVAWSVNGQKLADSNNPYLLNLNIGPETPQNAQINISVLVKNILKTLEFASQNIQLQIE